jgi:hypothetical protein
MRTVLLGDEELDRAVRMAWRRLEQARLSSLARHRHPTNRPHLTLASADEFSPDAAAAIAGALCMLPVTIRLDGLRFFGRRAGGAGLGRRRRRRPAGTAASDL